MDLRRIPLSRRSHITGFQPLATGTVEHESALERDFVTLTSFRHPDARIISQPVTLNFRDGAKTRRYTPDFLVQHSAAQAELVEVKYRADLRANWARLRPAFVAARQWARDHGSVFRIATERSIRGSMLGNAKRLLPLRWAPLDPAVAELVLFTIRSEKTPTLGGVLAALPVSRQAGLAALWRLIARGSLQVDLAGPITLHTRVSTT
jgi:TnsA endonuclease-like protein